jgi:hypothetical protein
MYLRFVHLFILMLIVNIFCSAQQLRDEDLPPGLVYEFNNRFPAVEQVQWSLKNDMYHADFVFMGNKVLALYDKNTRWISAETYYKTEDLPRNVQRYISTQFADQIVQGAKFHEQRGESGFFLISTLENSEKFELTFDKDGVFQSMTDSQGEEVVSGAISSEPGTKAVSARELPSPVLSYVQKTYPTYRIAQRYFINNNEFENTYYLILTSNIEKEKIQLWFDYKGTLIKEIDPNAKTEQYTEDPLDTKQKRKTSEQRKTLSESQVPQTVRDAFKKQVKRSEKVTWDTLQGNYVASYIDPIKKGNFRSEYTKSGKWVQTFGELNPKNINPNISRHLDQNYPTLRIHTIESLYRADRKRFTLVKIYDQQWLNDPMVYHELYFSQAGKLELENYASYIDPADQNVDVNRERKAELFLENVDKEDLVASEQYKKISTKQIPSKILKHIKQNYPEHRIAETYIVPDDETNETLYWIILRKEGIRIRTKAIYGFRGNFIEDEEF